MEDTLTPSMYRYWTPTGMAQRPGAEFIGRAASRLERALVARGLPASMCTPLVARELAAAKRYRAPLESRAEYPAGRASRAAVRRWLEAPPVPLP